MKKIICLMLVSLASPLLAMDASDEKQTSIDRIKAQLVAYEETIAQYSIESGLDVQQYYYLLGMRDAYRNSLLILDFQQLRELYLGSSDSGERSTSTDN